MTEPDPHDDPNVRDDVEVMTDAPVVAPRRASRLLLGVLAGLAVALAGVALWAVLYTKMEKDYVGVSVVIGLLVGYVVREVSRRADIPVRVIAALITAAACLLGTVVAEVAYTASQYHFPFWDLLKDQLPHTFQRLGKRNALTFVIYVAAIAVAFLSASPPRPKRVAAPPPPAEPSEDVAG